MDKKFFVAWVVVFVVFVVHYVVQPMPGAMVVKQIVFDGILLLVLGVVAAALSKPQAA